MLRSSIPVELDKQPLDHRDQSPCKNAETNVETLVRIFDACFRASENTVLKPGGEEPIYLPGETGREEAQVISTHDYFSSALHEISHWCIAGSERRKLVDYGYWYEPDGRTEAQQAEFERVEVKPQALEWLFTAACGQRFRISADNLDNPNVQPSDEFKQNIVVQAREYIRHGLSGRASEFFNALKANYYPEGKVFTEDDFCLDNL